MTEQSLGLLQLWMKTVVTERGSLDDKLQSAAQQHGLLIEEVVAEKRGLSARKRLSIYASGYVARLLECMRADFPALRRFVGDSVFDAFAKAYIVTEPPGSPSLFDLGAGFPRFLEETKPQGSSIGEMTALLDLPAEIARLERARTEVMRAPGTENDPPATASLSSFEILGQDLMLQMTPCLRLLELKFSLVDFIQGPDGDEPLPPPDRRLSFIAIGRSNYSLHIKEIEPWQFAFLKACENPVSVFEAVRRAAMETAKEPSSLLAQLVIWLPVAIQFGFLRQVFEGPPAPDSQV